MGRPGRFVVIGVGNRDRGDDAVGPVVCDLVRRERLPGVLVAVFEGSVVDLPLHWSSVDRVVIVDAAEPRREPGRVTRVDGLAEPLPVHAGISTHSIDVAAAIELARALDRLPVELTIVGIEGSSFEFGSPLDPTVERSAQRVAVEISRRAARPVVMG